MKRLIDWFRDHWQVVLFFLAVASIIPICLFLENTTNKGILSIFNIIMTIIEVIAIASLVGIVIMGIVWEVKYIKKKEREEYAALVYAANTCLRSIEHEFRIKCEELTEKYFQQYTDNIQFGYHEASVERLQRLLRNYQSEISNLEEDYLQNLSEKIIDLKGEYFVSIVPSYLVEAYERDISGIAFAFTRFYYCMDGYVTDIRIARTDNVTPRMVRIEREERLRKEKEEWKKRFQ